MWDELNRILGGNRKDGLPAGDVVRDRGTLLPENAPATPADVAPPESKNESPPSHDEHVGAFETLLSSGDLVGDSEWNEILEKLSGLVPPTTISQEEVPRSGAGSEAGTPSRYEYLIFTIATLVTGEPVAGQGQTQ